MKFGLRYLAASVAALSLTIGTAATYGQSANDHHPVAGMYSIVGIENIDAQHVKLSLRLRLFNRASGDIELAHFVFHPMFPVVAPPQRTSLSQLQTIASSLVVPFRGRAEITQDIILSKAEYLMRAHERRLVFQVTAQMPDGTTQTQNVVLRADRPSEVK